MDVPYNREPHFAVAEEVGGDIRLWVERKREFSGWVINGAWDVKLKGGRTLCEIGDIGPAVVVWRGKAPFDHYRYNEAIAWIKAEIAAGRGTGTTKETEVTK